MAKVIFKRNEIGEAVAGIFESKGLEVNYGEETIEVTGKRIALSRRELEKKLSKEVMETPWRLLWINREGEVKTLNAYEVKIEDEAGEDAEREFTTLTLKADPDFKAQIDEIRSMLNLTQNDFLYEAAREYIRMVKGEVA